MIHKQRVQISPLSFETVMASRKILLNFSWQWDALSQEWSSLSTWLFVVKAPPPKEWSYEVFWALGESFIKTFYNHLTIILRSSAHKGYFIKRVITAFKVINKYLFHETHCKMIVRNFLNATAWWVLPKHFTIVLWSSSHKGCFIKRAITAFMVIYLYFKYPFH